MMILSVGVVVVMTSLASLSVPMVSWSLAYLSLAGCLGRGPWISDLMTTGWRWTWGSQAGDSPPTNRQLSATSDSQSPAPQANYR